jgi:hypothetical protein
MRVFWWNFCNLHRRKLTMKTELSEVAPIQKGRYRHYKAKEYEVVDVARHSETMEELVVYRALYGERGLWVRPRAKFAESIAVNGRDVPRFEYVGPMREGTSIGYPEEATEENIIIQQHSSGAANPEVNRRLHHALQKPVN